MQRTRGCSQAGLSGDRGQNEVYPVREGRGEFLSRGTARYHGFFQGKSPDIKRFDPLVAACEKAT